jgi:hypothetical protein
MVEETGSAPHAVETMGGRVHVHWSPDAEVTTLGPVTYFLEFLKVTGIWDSWVESCPLNYTSPNAPRKEEILATVLLSVLAGHRRYAHITAIRSDTVLPRLLGVEKLRSEDAVRNAFKKGPEAAYTLWLDLQMDATFAPLLEHSWVLDVDATVKTVYGKQEEAEVGYNPTKPGRRSHCYHAYFIAALRMVLNVDVHAGNQTAAAYAQPGLWAWLDARPKKQWPFLIRGDVAWGHEEMMRQAEERKVRYLFKLRQSQGVQALLERTTKEDEWEWAGSGWRAREARLQLQGWSQARRVVVLRRRVREASDLGVAAEDEATGQRRLEGMARIPKGAVLYEYAVLVTNWQERELLTVAQMYRDRADAENIFDELKNQWGWTGFTTKDLRRSQLMARVIALIFNWWSLHTRWVAPGRHTEAVSSRPLLLYGVGRKTRHGNQDHMTITSLHAKAKRLAARLRLVSQELQEIWRTTEQLARPARWRAFLRRIFPEIYQPKPHSADLPAIA